MVKLAAKGMAERDNHLMPKSVTTPEEFYEIMARTALDAIGLQTLLEELARAEQELKHADEKSTHGINADTATILPEEPPDPPQYGLDVPPVMRIGYEARDLDTPDRHEHETRKVENARLRSKMNGSE